MAVLWELVGSGVGRMVTRGRENWEQIEDKEAHSGCPRFQEYRKRALFKVKG